MEGKYRKIMVAMKRESHSYQFWKQEAELPVCYVESYKEKRAVFFRSADLLPGTMYHLLLIGSAEGNAIYQDFGPLHTGGNGELQCYKTFGGAELEAYEYCLLCAEGTDGQPEIVYKGAICGSVKTIWDTLCKVDKETDVFTKNQDETGACWYRIENLNTLPREAKSCLPWISAYGHYIIGRKEGRCYLGVPGRFLQSEQPLREEGIFLLWQPIRGGEEFFVRPDLMNKRQQEKIFGYWIAEIDVEKGNLLAI